MLKQKREQQCVQHLAKSGYNKPLASLGWMDSQDASKPLSLFYEYHMEASVSLQALLSSVTHIFYWTLKPLQI